MLKSAVEERFNRFLSAMAIRKRRNKEIGTDGGDSDGG